LAQAQALFEYNRKAPRDPTIASQCRAVEEGTSRGASSSVASSLAFFAPMI